MPHSEHYAKELLRNRPGHPTALLEQRKYWDLTFLRLYLDHCDTLLFDNPKAGLQAAVVAPKLALLIPERRPYEWKEFTSESEKQQHRELLAKSQAVLGGAYRATARFEEADEAYAEVARICSTGPVCPTIRANLDKRLAKLRSAQRRFGEALNLIDSSIEIYKDTDTVYHADAILTKGYILFELGRFSESVPLFAEALFLAGDHRRVSSVAARTVYCAVHNLAETTARICSVDDIIVARRYVNQAKRFLSKKRASINKHKLSWIEGRIDGRLGSARAAERRFLGAIEPLLKLGAVFEAALVALDLSVIYFDHREWDQLKELAAATFERFRELSSDREAIAALRLWMDGARESTLTRAKILGTKDTIASLMRQ